MKRLMVWMLGLSIMTALAACGGKTASAEAPEVVSEAEADEVKSGDKETPFDETDIFQVLVGLIDENFESTPHEVVFDREENAVNIYFEAPENSREAIGMGLSEIAEAWQKLSDSMISLCDSALEVVKTSGNVSEVNVYIVDQLLPGNRYGKDEYLLWVKNGVVKYDYAE